MDTGQQGQAEKIFPGVVKVCLTCGAETGQYHRNSSRPDGYQDECKTCCRKRYIRVVYGLHPESEVQMKLAQGNRCAICQKAFGEERQDKANIDHDHKTGNVRGLLCGDCNLGIGRLKDSREILQRAIDYLTWYEGFYSENPPIVVPVELVRERAPASILRSDNSSGFRGVYWYEQRKKWRVKLTRGKKVVFVKTFEDLAEAVISHDIAVVRLFGNDAVINGMA